MRIEEFLEKLNIGKNDEEILQMLSNPMQMTEIKDYSLKNHRSYEILTAQILSLIEDDSKKIKVLLDPNFLANSNINSRIILYNSIKSSEKKFDFSLKYPGLIETGNIKKNGQEITKSSLNKNTDSLFYNSSNKIEIHDNYLYIAFTGQSENSEQIMVNIVRYDINSQEFKRQFNSQIMHQGEPEKIDFDVSKEDLMNKLSIYKNGIYRDVLPYCVAEQQECYIDKNKLSQYLNEMNKEGLNNVFNKGLNNLLNDSNKQNKREEYQKSQEHIQEHLASVKENVTKKTEEVYKSNIEREKSLNDQEKKEKEQLVKLREILVNKNEQLKQLNQAIETIRNISPSLVTKEQLDKAAEIKSEIEKIAFELQNQHDYKNAMEKFDSVINNNHLQDTGMSEEVRNWYLENGPRTGPRR